MSKILLTTVPFGDKDRLPLELLEEANIEYFFNPFGRKLTEQELANIVPGFEVLIAGTESITNHVLQQGKNLKMISRVGIGLDNVDLLAAEMHGIKVSYTPDAPAPAVAELTVGLMLSLLRYTHLSNSKMHNGHWYRHFGRRISEVTIGIIGVGRIGKRVVSHLSGFNCKRVMVNDLLTNQQTDDHVEVEWQDKETIYREADLISLHVPLNPLTENMISREELEMMKPDAIIINTARGGIINERDLYDLMDSDHQAGAAVDVFKEEPYSGFLCDIDRCILTSHMGSMTEDCRVRMEVEATEEAIRFLKGKSLEKQVPEDEYEVQREWSR